MKRCAGQLTAQLAKIKLMSREADIEGSSLATAYKYAKTSNVVGFSKHDTRKLSSMKRLNDIF